MTSHTLVRCLAAATTAAGAYLPEDVLDSTQSVRRMVGTWHESLVYIVWDFPFSDKALEVVYPHLNSCSVCGASSTVIVMYRNCVAPLPSLLAPLTVLLPTVVSALPSSRRL